MLSNFDFLKSAQNSTPRKPISTGAEWRLFEPHSLFQCGDSYGKVMGRLTVDKQTPTGEEPYTYVSRNVVRMGLNFAT